METLLSSDRPPLLMEALAEVRASSLCNMFNYGCVIITLQDFGFELQADWLEEHLDSSLKFSDAIYNSNSILINC
ncbi:hypothetical protein [Nostoc sp.]